MGVWAATTTRDAGGYHRIVATPPGKSARDITFVRGAPVQLSPYSTADPFGDTTASISCPMLTGFDDPSSDELAFMAEDTGIDIWWIPAMPVPEGWVAYDQDTMLWVNPLTGKKDIICPAYDYLPVLGVYARTRGRRGTKVWEGHVASVEVEDGEGGGGVSLACQGALFQADLTLAKPSFPARPKTLESLIMGAFSKTANPSLRTHAPHIQWPSGWTKVAPSWDGTDDVFKPNVRPGAKWTGYTTRNTGGWDHTLTSYLQNLLAVMLVKPGSGIAPGSQWTLQNVVEGDPDFPRGRTPVLRVRDRYGAPKFSMWVGTPGLSLSLTRDATQAENVIYGTGTDLAGTTWRNAVIADDGSRTDYRPMAWLRGSWPAENNKQLDRSRFLRESYIQYGPGFSAIDASESAALTLDRNQDPGWSGTATLRSDPSPTLSRWQLRAGITVTLQGFHGTGERGMRFHAAGVEARPEDGSVVLTLDTRYRDLITLNEAIARTRDALTPAKLLTLNRNSVTIEDIQAPWDYSAGSGFIPPASRFMYAHKPTSSRYPYIQWLIDHPPHKHPDWYVGPCHSGASDSQRRWVGPIRILMAEKGTIRRTEIFCVNETGHLVKDKFHVSFWYQNGINAAAMPNNGKTWSPFIFGAFEAQDPRTGQPWATNPTLAPQDGLVAGWGNYAQPAGYSPGLKTQGGRPTGLLVDEGPWNFDCSVNNNNYDQLAKAGREKKNVISIYAMFYSEHGSPVYFGGRLLRQEPGVA